MKGERAQYSNTPLLRTPGFEDEGESEEPDDSARNFSAVKTPGVMTDHLSPFTFHISHFTSRLSRLLVWVAIGFFVLNVLAVIAVVVVNSFATTWLGTWLPSGFTLRWYSTAWSEFQLDSILTVTVEVVFAVVAISLLLGVPAAYALARRNFRFKRAVLLIFVLP